MTIKTHRAILNLAASILLIACSGCDLSDVNEIGTLSGKVTDFHTGGSIGNVLVEIAGEDLSDRSSVDGSYTVDNVPEGIFTVRASVANYVESVKSRIEIYKDQITTLNIKLAPFGKVGALTGQVSNAVTGNPIANAVVTIEREYVVAVTDTLGYYIIENIPVSVYSVSAAAKNFHRGYSDNIEIFANSTITSHFALSPNLDQTSGEMRIILTWGLEPLDLNAHVKTPEIDEQRYHIFFASRGDSSEAPHVWFDRDDADSYGPETITFHQTHSGIYYYFIYNFSQEPELTVSEAKVSIYDRSGLSQTFNIPAEGEGLYWYVCDIDLRNNTITPINRIQESEPGPVITTNSVASNLKKKTFLSN